MANTFYGEYRLADKSSPDKKLMAAIKAMSGPVHVMIIDNDLITPDQQVAVFSVLDEHGTATLGECMAALQPHDRPVAALISLAKLGLIAFDGDAEFDEHMSVWRIR